MLIHLQMVGSLAAYPFYFCKLIIAQIDMQIGSTGRHVSTPLSEFEGPPCAQPAHNTPLDITSPSPSPPLELTDARHRLQRQINKLRQADSLHGHGQQPQAPPLPTVSRTSNLHSEKIEKRREGRKMHCPTVLDQQEHINMDHAQAVQQRKTSAKRPRMSLSVSLLMLVVV